MLFTAKVTQGIGRERETYTHGKRLIYDTWEGDREHDITAKSGKK